MSDFAVSLIQYNELTDVMCDRLDIDALWQTTAVFRLRACCNGAVVPVDRLRVLTPAVQSPAYCNVNEVIDAVAPGAELTRRAYTGDGHSLFCVPHHVVRFVVLDATTYYDDDLAEDLEPRNNLRVGTYTDGAGLVVDVLPKGSGTREGVPGVVAVTLPVQSCAVCGGSGKPTIPGALACAACTGTGVDPEFLDTYYARMLNVGRVLRSGETV